MSRIGRKPVAIPGQVSVELHGNKIKVKGPHGELARELHPSMEIVQEKDRIIVNRPSDDKEHRSLHGLTRTLVANMFEGVTKGFSKNLEINGVGYKAAMQGKKLVLTVGFSHPVEIEAPATIKFEVPAPNKIIISGPSKELVGQVAAQIRNVRKPEPYQGKGIKYEGEYIRRKAGKAGKTTK
ncbi:MAG: 50S ribosomal protein L6 [Bacillota bacterium]